jgi:hypothetical protein
VTRYVLSSKRFVVTAAWYQIANACAGFAFFHYQVTELYQLGKRLAGAELPQALPG